MDRPEPDDDRQPADNAATALMASTGAFTACFAVWTIFSIIGLSIKEELSLSETEFGLLIGTPILTGSLSRIFLGVWSDQFGGRRLFVTVMVLSLLFIEFLEAIETHLFRPEKRAR